MDEHPGYREVLRDAEQGSSGTWMTWMTWKFQAPMCVQRIRALTPWDGEITPLLCRSSGSSGWWPQNHCMICTLPAPRQKRCKHTNTTLLHQCSQQHCSWSWGQCPSVTYGQMLCLHDGMLLIHKRPEEPLHEQMDLDCIMPKEGRQRKTATCPVSPHMEIVWNR